MSNEPSLPKDWKYTYQPVEGPKEKIPEAPPNPMLTSARKVLRRWDLRFECSGVQSWIETTGTKKKIWLILQNGDEVQFEPLD